MNVLYPQKTIFRYGQTIIVVFLPYEMIVTIIPEVTAMWKLVS